ncbi:sensor histidine kinase [Flavobacterium sp. SUN052]|uniref:sensor histidine kinase n=1 Tax=Flavobacterium sp. SUN052 TaxID=3002441 RepID=UPI00237E30FA|nr:sensor histidine kinase [Flavobacterium sp. SUN052]MEC4005903.1 sensor histidine kinase [Flavobacterium sp. SUN052]
MQKCSRHFFCFFIILIVTISCKKSEVKLVQNPVLSKEVNWFKQDSNYKNPKLYQDKFTATYTACIKNKQYEQAKLLLFYYGDLVSKMYVGDSVYEQFTKDFLNKKYPVKKDSTFVRLYYLIGSLTNNKNQIKESILWCEKALEYNKICKSNKLDLETKNLLGLNYVYSNNPKKGLRYYLEIIPVLEKDKKYREIGIIYNNICDAYDMLHAYDDWKKFHKKASINLWKGKDFSNYFSLQGTFAINNFEHEKDTLNTIRFIDSVITIFKDYKKPTEYDSISINDIIALKKYLKKDYDAAKYYNQKNIDYYKKNQNILLLRFCEMFDAKIYFQKNKKIEDENKIKLIADELLQNESYFESQELFNLLYENAKLKNDYKKALEYRNLEMALKDSTLNQNIQGQLFELDKKYESEKKEKKIAQQNTVISTNKFYITLLIGTLLMLVLGTIIYFFRKNKLEAQAEIKRQEQFTFQLLQNTEEERSRISGELHDSVNHNLLNIKNNLIKGNAVRIDDVASIIEEVRNISRNLHPAILENIGLEASIESLCERVSEIGLFTTCDINYTTSLAKSKELQLYRIIQEALNNTLKHGKANAAKVILTSQNNYLHLEVKDNGKGFDVAHQLKNPKSFGLQSIMQRAKAIAAKININSSDKGTIILLKIPI